MKILSKLLIPVLIGAFIQVADAQTFMTEEEMLATFPGAKIGGISSRDGKTPWQQTYGKPKKGKSKGNGKGLWNTDTYNFYWKIKKGQWCEKYTKKTECFNFERIDETTMQGYSKGEKLKNVWNIVEPAP